MHQSWLVSALSVAEAQLARRVVSPRVDLPDWGESDHVGCATGDRADLLTESLEEAHLLGPLRSVLCAVSAELACLAAAPGVEHAWGRLRV